MMTRLMRSFMRDQNGASRMAVQAALCVMVTGVAVAISTVMLRR